MLLQHPRIYLFSAALTVINLITFCICVYNGNATGIAWNGVFLIFNLIATIGNFRIRHHRAILREEQKMERRNQLIRLTIGE
jgi:hypothetical protein